MLSDKKEMTLDDSTNHFDRQGSFLFSLGI